MRVMTKHFGEIELDESKIINFPSGILGFDNYKEFTILYDNEEGERPDISWLQSIDEPSLAIPIMSPFLVMEEYNPEVEDELLKPLGDMKPDNMIVLVSVTVPSDVTKLSANMKAPFIINAETKKGIQIIIEKGDYEIKYHFYEKLAAIKEAKEGQ
ncbi:MAG TPA: flagellar assembly protein FliW [Clostridiales bacterium]|nr:flagellar assembly protein FliW [Clostridiales bacterium]